MSAPVIISTIPAAGDSDIVLGSVITITFDQTIDLNSVTSASFALTGPGQTQLVDHEQIGLAEPPSVGREYITGSFSFPTSSPANSVLVFTPSSPFRPDTTYTLLLVGGNTLLALSTIKNSSGVSLANSYQWSFTTGSLNLVTPPVSSPLTWEQTQENWDRPRLSTSDIEIYHHLGVGNNLSSIELLFPAPVDVSSFDPQALLVSVGALLNDPLVQIPPGSVATVAVSGRSITITIVGLP